MADPKTDKQTEAEAHVDTLVRRGLKALEQFRELNQEWTTSSPKPRWPRWISTASSPA